MDICIISDAQGFYAKQILKKYLESDYSKERVVDLGEFNDFTESKYDELAKRVVDFFLENRSSICFLIDLTGSGIAMYANKIEGIKAYTCFNLQVAKEALEDFSVNMFAISALTDLGEAREIFDLILRTKNELAK